MVKLLVKKDKRSDLEKEFDRAMEKLEMMELGSKEYLEQLSVVERLRSMLDSEKSQHKTISPDMIATVALGIVQVGVVAYRDYFVNLPQKALTFVTKGRVR